MDRFQDLKVRLYGWKEPPEIKQLMGDRQREASEFLASELDKSAKEWPPRNE